MRSRAGSQPEAGGLWSSAQAGPPSTLAWRTTRRGRELGRAPGGDPPGPPGSPGTSVASNTCGKQEGLPDRAASPHGPQHPQSSTMYPCPHHGQRPTGHAPCHSLTLSTNLPPVPPALALTSPPRGSSSSSWGCGDSIRLMLRMTAQREMRGRWGAPDSPGPAGCLLASSGGCGDGARGSGLATSSPGAASSGSGWDTRSAARGSQRTLCRLPREHPRSPAALAPSPAGEGGAPKGERGVASSGPTHTDCWGRGHSTPHPRGVASITPPAPLAPPTWRSGCPGRSQAGA